MKRTSMFLLALMLTLQMWSQTANILSTSKAAVRSVSTATDGDQGKADVKVWVNTASGVYHCPGTRWYGNTKHGEYMSQAEAQKKGNRPAYGKVCK